jgi:Fe2+ transport system protein FeoA
MSLLEAPIEIQLKILQLGSCSESKRKLTSLGLHIDDYLIKLNNNRWGPLLVKNLSGGDNKIALCRHLASKIVVSE